MKKAALIIFAVAILGVIGAVKAQKPAASTSVNLPSASMPQNMTSANSGRMMNSAIYKDGTFVGNAADTPYGTVQVGAVITGGKISDILFVQMPFEERHSQEITDYSKPYLKQSAIEKQNPQNLDFVTGATSTSYGFQESLQAALNKAANS